MKAALKIFFSLFIFLTFIPASNGAGVDHTFNPYVIQTNSSDVRIIAVQPDGKYLVGGEFNTAGGAARGSIARFNADGTVDRGFVTPFDGEAVKAIIVLDDGKILVAGDVRITLNGTTRYGLFRLNSNGSLDQTFLNGPGIEKVETMARQPDGKILVGDVTGTIDGVQIQGLARFNPDGSFDSTFRPPAATAFSVIALPDGKIMSCGAFSVPGNNRMMVRLNNDGSWDPSFSIASNPQISILKLLSNGKILLGGRFSMINDMERLKIVRLNADGSLDDSFVSGLPTNSLNPEPLVFFEQPDGKILVGGNFTSFDTINTLYRLNNNGSVDPGFSVLHLAPPVVAVAALPSGQIIVGNGTPPEISYPYHNPLMRLNSDGIIDTSYTGLVGYPTFVGAMEESPDGKIYIGGDFYDVNGQARKRIARLNPNGTLDPTFNPNAATNGQVYDLAVQPDGKVVIAGDFATANGRASPRLARLNADGTTDLSFNVGQGATSTVNKIALQSDGKIILGGTFTSFDNVPRRFIARVNADGSLDTSFNLPSPGLANSVFDIVSLPDGKTLISGAFGSVNGIIKGHIARLNANGTFDASFNAGGAGAGGPGDVLRSVNTILVQTDGKIMIGGGFSTYNNVPRAALARLNPDGSLDQSFTTGTQGGVSVLRQQADGRILLGGNFSSVGGIPQNRLARLNVDGTVDTSFDIGLGPDLSIYRMIAKPNGSILIAGLFRKFDGQDHIGLARIGKPTSGIFDFDGDGRTDISIYRPSLGEWWINKSGGGSYAAQFGTSSDKITPADFTGDCKTDIAIFRPSTGEWFVLRSEDSSFYSFPFGTAGDLPSVGDFDGDNKADSTVFRASDATWYIRRSSDGQALIQQFGQSGDMPVVADYDGDNKADLAIYRVASGEWWINRSTAGLIAFQFGNSTDKPVQGDYTGDGKADVALFRPSTGEWFVLRSENQSYYSFPFGTNGDTPAPGDYDGDGKHDATVFRPSNNTWYSNRSSSTALIQTFGQSGDMPIPSAFVP